MNFRNRLSSARAFTLVELLTVMGIMIVMVGLGVSAFRGGASGSGVKGASSVMGGLCSTARSEAMLRQTRTRVVIDTAYDPAKPQNFLRRATIAYYDPEQPSNWQFREKWEVLPIGVFYNTDYSHPHGKDMKLPSSFGKASADYWFYEFLPNGQANQSLASDSNVPVQLLVSPGLVAGSGVFQPRNPKNPTADLYGFMLPRMGNPLYFNDVQVIQRP
jgi:type II secretory pathway pseudopilin PulG